MRTKGCLEYQTRGWILESVITEKGLRAKLLSRRGGVISDDACALPSQQFKYGPYGTLHPTLIFHSLSPSYFNPESLNIRTLGFARISAVEN